VSEPLHNLVQLARNNHESAWDQLFRAYQLRIFAYAKNLTGDREAAFDIVQESFIRAIANVGDLRDDSRFGSWLFGIAHQRCMLHFRRTKREVALFGDEDHGRDGEADWPDPREALLQEERAEALYALVDNLPLQQRSALLLHVLGEFSLEDVAAIVDVPVGTVKSRLHHAKRALRSLIEEAKP
jgi:RNA polymerase sigma-70 factor (ECF subfamily)